MSTTPLALVVLVAALGCPAHMLWQMRRCKQAACSAPARRTDLGDARARQQALGDELAGRMEADAQSAQSGPVA